MKKNRAGLFVLPIGFAVFIYGCFMLLQEHTERLPDGSDKFVGTPTAVVLPLLLSGFLICFWGVCLLLASLSSRGR